MCFKSASWYIFTKQKFALVPNGSNAPCTFECSLLERERGREGERERERELLNQHAGALERANNTDYLFHAGLAKSS